MEKIAEDDSELEKAFEMFFEEADIKDFTLYENQVTDDFILNDWKPKIDNFILSDLGSQPITGKFRKRNTASELITLSKRKKKGEVKKRGVRNKGRPKKNGTVRKPRKRQPKTSQEDDSKPLKTSFVRRKTSRRRTIEPDAKITGAFERKLPWTLAALALHMSSNEAALKFCQEKGLLPKTKQCPVCMEEMLYSEKLSSDKGLGYVFRCSRRACQIVRSARSGTWFEKSKLPIRKSLLLTYCFATNFPFNLAVHESSFTAGCTSPTTVSDWYTYCREVCVDAMTRQMADKVGGPTCVIEMDEAKVGERQVGQKTFNGQTVLGFYCRMTKKVSLVCLPNNKCDASTLVPVIEEHVNPGSTIIVDCWDAEEMLGPGYYHLVNNCNFKFVAPESGLRNSGIEKIWRSLKSSYPQAENYRKTYQLNEYLCEFLWRRWVDISLLDPFEAFLHDASLLYTLSTEEDIS